MKTFNFFAGFICIAILLSVVPSFAQGNWSGNANVTIGHRNMTNDGWKMQDGEGDYSTQTVVGIDVDFKRESWP